MTKNMTSGNPAKLIFFFALPLIIGNIFQQFYSMADTMIVGRTIGVTALAAVGCTGSLSFFIIGFVNGFTSGLAVITAQRFGAKDMEGVKKSFATGILLTIFLSIGMTILAVLIARPVLELLQTPAEILDDATSYITIIFAGIGATALFNLCSNMLRALGDSKMPLCFLVIACLLNIVLDLVLILFFHMGVAGAGTATVFSQLVSGICCLIYIKYKVPAFWISRKHFELHRREVSAQLRIAFPMAFQMSIIAIGSLIVQSVLNTFGSTAVASYTAAQKIDSIATMPLNSFGSAMSTYTAQNYGAGKQDRIRKGVTQCILMSVSFSIVMGLVNIFFGGNLASLFVGNSEPQVLENARTYLSISGSLYWSLALLFIYRFTLQGLGNSSIPTLSGVLELLMRIFAALVLARLAGFTGICCSCPLAWIVACIPLGIAYHTIMRRFETTGSLKLSRS